MPTIAPYGAWVSPLKAGDVAAAGRRVAEVVVDGSNVYWGESRPDEGGRVTIMRRTPDGAIAELLPQPFNARTRVHEYGGGAFAAADGVVYFSNFADQRLWQVTTGAAPVAVTAEGAWRYADGVIDRARRRMICVREDHTGCGHEPKNEIVGVDLADGAVTVLVTGADFYAAPRLSAAGDRLCWIAWDHPNMPWDGTVLSVADVAADGSLRDGRVVAGCKTESIYCPLWSPSGDLHFVSDRSGWWNLYRVRDGVQQALWPLTEEFGVPLWNFGSATYGFDGDNLVCVFGAAGARRLARIASQGGPGTVLPLPYAELGTVRVGQGKAVLTAAGPAVASELITVDLTSGAHMVLRQPSTAGLAADFVSMPETIAFPTTAGTAFAFHYAPVNPEFAAPDGEKPPLMVICHGGPTASTSTAYSPGIQYWTTRGFGVLDVNYGGSTGYGRAYRERLNGQWGIVDVADCENGARFLAARGDVDPARMVIRGGSAGGYTTLCALTFGTIFRAGASHYGIGDLEALEKDTHKFEARYTDGLVAAYPQRRDLYVARSPIHHVEQLKNPMIFFQGLEDKVVPPQQAEAMVAALKAKGVAVAYLPFAGEGHGFRRAENIVRALEAELYFYGRVLGFVPADHLAPVMIENLTGG